ncbi:hypothetical protein [Christiangramia flava]|uniref:Glycine dehydrogenase n=1 Tax=Christiangramia flava JLT2011 TaxID=1229726 RepID=A0A1L7I1Q2_9FLAO|nr:hypothetical protein [Christiangramia flava]APU67548.1 hypothetical protein GRFL_0824 [Christiangramia flava JLT2011]
MGFLQKLFHIDCAEANNCCDKAQYRNANFFDKCRLMLHLAYCKACRKYTSKNKKLTKLMENSRIERCTEAQKKQWKDAIQKEYAKENP